MGGETEGGGAEWEDVHREMDRLPSPTRFRPRASDMQVTHSLVDIASSAERLGKRIVSGDSIKPVCLDSSIVCTSANAPATSTAKAALDDSVKLVKFMLLHIDADLISVQSFPGALNKSDGAQKLTRSVKSAMSGILMRCNERCTEAVRSPGGD